MLICCRYERLLTSVNPLIRWNQATFYGPIRHPPGWLTADLLTWQSKPYEENLSHSVSSTQSSSIHAWRPKVGLFFVSVCPKRYPAWTPVNCPGMSTYKQIIVCGVKVPEILQLLCPFLRAKTAISHEPLVGVGVGGGEAVNPFPQTRTLRWYHVKHLHGSVCALLGSY